MTQRIFDIENEKDYADLWDIVPEEIKTIYKDSNEFPVYYINTPEIDGVIPCPVGLFKINWHDKTEIARPVNYEKMVGCVGWFWDNDDDEKSLGILTGYFPETGFPFVNNTNNDCFHFRPAKKSELKFWGE